MKALNNVDNQRLVTIKLLREEDVQSQVQATIDMIHRTTEIQIKSSLDIVQTMYRANAILSSLGTNVYISTTYSTVNLYPAYYRNQDDELDRLFNRGCFDRASFARAVFYSLTPYESLRTQPFWLENQMYSSHGIVSAWVGGFYGACLATEALLASTLDCLYNNQCLLTLAEYFPSLNRVCVIRVLVS